MKPSKNYVVGFMFDRQLQNVALIRKNRPAWQKGLLNGVGGQVEAEETPLQAITREFEEETGQITAPEQWAFYHTMSGQTPEGNPFQVDFFSTTGILHQLQSKTDEAVEIWWLQHLHPLKPDLVENLCWLVALGLDNLQDGRPFHSTSSYQPIPEGDKYYEIISSVGVIGVCCAPIGNTESLQHAASEDRVQAFGEITQSQFDSYGDTPWVAPISTQRWTLNPQWTLVPANR